MIIHKYELDLPLTEIELSINDVALSVGVQHGRPYIWVLKEFENAKDGAVVKRVFRTVLTGQKVDHFLSKLNFIGTFQIQDGLASGLPFVGHVFKEE